MSAKQCPTCGETKPLEEFHRSAKTRDGRNTYCKPCAVERVARRRLELLASGPPCRIPECSDPVRSDGLCEMHYQRKRKHGDPRKVLVKQARKGEPRAFLDSVLDGTAPREPNGCILWPYAKHPAGYARIHLDGSFVPATAVVLDRLIGPKPSPDHTAGHAPHDVCGHTDCVAPEHLSWQTWTEQDRNRQIDGTHFVPAPRTGEQHQSVTVSDAGVAEAIRRVQAGETRAAVARDIGVSKVTVGNWVNGTMRSTAKAGG